MAGSTAFASCWDSVEAAWRVVHESAITGRSSIPTIFDEASGKTDAHDEGIRAKARLMG